jgi:hypothetical protein
MLDFDGNESLVVKYGVYTLVCEQLLAHLQAFEPLLHQQSELGLDDVKNRVNQVLSDILSARPGSVTEAASLAAGSLEAKCRVLATVNQPIADALTGVATSIRDHGDGWNYQLAVERWQAVGCELARQFYDDTPYSITQERLAREPLLAFEYVSRAGETPFGYREARWYVGQELEDGVIFVRFSFADSVHNYLAYPFFFLHEYISHVYGADTDNELFEDGWLLSAANDFMRRQVQVPGFSGLHSEQIDVFERDVLPRMQHRKKARDGYFMAGKFLAFCEGDLRCCFEALNGELAALPVTAGFPHGNFLYALVGAMEERPADLRSWLHTTCACRELLRRLKPAVRKMGVSNGETNGRL